MGTILLCNTSHEYFKIQNQYILTWQAGVKTQLGKQK